MVLPHNLRAPIDMMRPRPVGISDKSGFMYFLDYLEWQYQWQGRALVNQRTLSSRNETDQPSEFLRTFIFGPEPAPLVNARPTQYATQNQGGVPAPTNVNNLVDDIPPPSVSPEITVSNSPLTIPSATLGLAAIANLSVPNPVGTSPTWTIRGNPNLQIWTPDSVVFYIQTVASPTFLPNTQQQFYLSYTDSLNYYVDNAPRPLIITA